MLEFDKNEIIKIKDKAVAWIRDWFESNGKNCNAVIGISGGKDSSVVAALCVEALGKDRVIGVLMPNGNQADINDAFDLVNFLGIRSITTDIHIIVNDAINAIQYGIYDLAVQDANSVVISEQTKVNLPARIRMTMLYAIAQSNNGRVANTCNRSENYLGYSTLWGDDVGDFSPLGELTCNEVIAIGEILGLPDKLIHKMPSDGLTGKTDEDNFGFSYDEVDAFLLRNSLPNMMTAHKMLKRHCDNWFKQTHKILPTFNPY